MGAGWEGFGGVKKRKGLGRTSWQLQNSHEDINYSIRNIVSNIVITIIYMVFAGG